MKNRGWFQRGQDSRRHTFTREECRRGFKAAEESLQRRYPGCDVHFLMCAIIGCKPWNEAPVWKLAVAQYQATGRVDDSLFATD